MTTTDELLARLRRFEWACARDEHAREVAEAVRQRSHDLLNLVQVVDLASQQLVARCGEVALELAGDLHRAAREGRAVIDGLAALGPSRPEPRITARTAVAVIARGVVVRGQVTVGEGDVVAWAAGEIELLLFALQLDAPDGELVVRGRSVDEGKLVEIVCGPIAREALAVRVATALARVAGGDLTMEPCGEGQELVVAIPTV
jgi:hypothetical protein